MYFTQQQQNNLSEPLPLLSTEKQDALASEVKQPKLILLNRNGEPLHQPTTQGQYLPQLKDPSHGKYAGGPHQCERDKDKDRCFYCSRSMKLFNMTYSSIQKPYEIIYADFVSTFLKKLDATSNNCAKLKKFLMVNNLRQLNQIVYYLLDREKQLGLYNLYQQDTKRIPRYVKTHEEFLLQQNQPADFNEKFKIFGDFEGSNISHYTVKQDKISVLIRSDTNTKGCIHWFCFGVEALQECQLTFSLLNNQRNGVFYKDGMQIAVYDSMYPEKGWHRAGENIFYYKSNVDHAFYQTGNTVSQMSVNAGSQENAGNPNQNQPAKKGFQQLDFTYKFIGNGQKVVFAYCFPYTLTDLHNFLESQEVQLLNSPKLEEKNLNDKKRQLKITTESIIYKKKILCATRLGLPVLLLKIQANKRTGLYKKRKRKVIFIIARQHPGETPSSFVCQGIIKFLLGDTEQAQYLRELYIFKIVPLVNPDGVVMGNTRCNISGKDLNRKWHQPDKATTPEIYYIKEQMKKCSQKREIHIFTDLHGHSQRKHSFIFGCNQASNGGTSTWTKVRLIPRILSKRTPFFTINDCRFRVTDDKQSTARITAWNELKITNSFTLETSFYGYKDIADDNKTKHFTIRDYETIGEQLCLSFLEYSITLDQLQFELVQTNGWLKPYRLIEVTGKSAQQQIEQDLKVQKKLDKEKQRLKRIESRGVQSQNSNSRKSATPLKAQKEHQKLKIKKTLSNEINNFQSNLNADPTTQKKQQTERKENQENGRSYSPVKTSSFGENGCPPEDKKKGKASTASGANNFGVQDDEDEDEDYEERAKAGESQVLHNLNNSTKASKRLSQEIKEKSKSSQKHYREDSEDSTKASGLSRNLFTEICPEIKKDWRDYFTKEELEKNFLMIEAGGDPNDKESSADSDSDAEQDIYNEQELKQLQKIQEISDEEDSDNEAMGSTIQGKRPKEHSETTPKMNRKDSSRNANGFQDNSDENNTQSENSRNRPKQLSKLIPGYEKPGHQQLQQNSSKNQDKSTMYNSANLGQSHQNGSGGGAPGASTSQRQNVKIIYKKQKQVQEKQSYPIAKVGQTFAKQPKPEEKQTPQPQSVPQSTQLLNSNAHLESVRMTRNIVAYNQSQQHSNSKISSNLSYYQNQESLSTQNNGVMTPISHPVLNGFSENALFIEDQQFTDQDSLTIENHPSQNDPNKYKRGVRNLNSLMKQNPSLEPDSSLMKKHILATYQQPQILQGTANPQLQYQLPQGRQGQQISSIQQVQEMRSNPRMPPQEKGSQLGNVFLQSGNMNYIINPAQQFESMPRIEKASSNEKSRISSTSNNINGAKRRGQSMNDRIVTYKQFTLRGEELRKTSYSIQSDLQNNNASGMGHSRGVMDYRNEKIKRSEKILQNIMQDIQQLSSIRDSQDRITIGNELPRFQKSSPFSSKYKQAQQTQYLIGQPPTLSQQQFHQNINSSITQVTEETQNAHYLLGSANRAKEVYLNQSLIPNGSNQNLKGPQALLSEKRSQQIQSANSNPGEIMNLHPDLIRSNERFDEQTSPNKRQLEYQLKAQQKLKQNKTMDIQKLTKNLNLFNETYFKSSNPDRYQAN